MKRNVNKTLEDAQKSNSIGPQSSINTTMNRLFAQIEATQNSFNDLVNRIDPVLSQANSSVDGKPPASDNSTGTMSMIQSQLVMAVDLLEKLQQFVEETYQRVEL